MDVVVPLLLLYMEGMGYQWDKVTQKCNYNKHFYPKWLTIASHIAQELNPVQLFVIQQY